MTKIEKIGKKVNDEFRNKLKDKMKGKFGITIKSEWSLFSMRLVTSKEDESNFTRKQLDFIGAYSDGYEDAMNQVTEYK